MYEFSITKNTDADHEYFDYWMRNQYPSYEGFSFVGDTSYISIYTTEQFSQADINAVKAFYDALTVEDTIEKKHCVIYDYIAPWVQTDTDKTTPPCHINYTTDLTRRLQPMVTNIYKGEVREVVYYADATVNAQGLVEATNPVVKEVSTYYRDVAKMAIYRTMQIYWYLKDGTLFTTAKVRTKYYAPQEKIVEGQKLRGNIIDFMQPNVLGMLMQTEQISYDDAVTMGAELFHKYAAEISSWVYASRGNTLPQMVEDDTEVLWLDNVIDGQGTTIRDYIVDQLNY